MKKLIIPFAGLVLCIFFMACILHNYMKTVDKIDNKYKSHLGETFILEKDTLKIVDYSYWGSTYTLSNGKKINYNLVENGKSK